MKLQYMLANELMQEQHHFLFFKTIGSFDNSGAIRLLKLYKNLQNAMLESCLETDFF